MNPILPPDFPLHGEHDKQLPVESEEQTSRCRCGNPEDAVRRIAFVRAFCRHVRGKLGWLSGRYFGTVLARNADIDEGML
jgi:hypothetical protein